MGEDQPTGLDFRVLGPLEVVKETERLSLGGPKQRSVLAALLVRHGSPVSTDALVDAVWGEQPPKTAAKTLQKYVSHLRKQLGGVLVTHSGGYALEVACDQIDACRFEMLIDRAGAAEQARGLSLVGRALGLWRGDPYEDLDDHIEAIAERSRLRERRLEAVELEAELELALGRHDRLVGRLEELVRRYPLRERLWASLMVALYRSGRQAEALRAFQRLRSELAEVGIDPSPDLKDLEERILQQDAALGKTSSAVRSPANNLPRRLTSFIGRRTELADLAGLLPATRMVTLVGPGGSGKTSLALECAAATVKDYPDGSWFVDLAPLTSPDELAQAFAEPLGLRGGPERSVEAVLLDYVTDRRLLLLVDNCEHLVEAAADLVTSVLRAGPDVQVIATSREPLGVAGETTLEVGPLAAPDASSVKEISSYDAVRLFVARAQAADPHFELTDTNAPAIAAVCRRLDGMPLAIELAAARARAFTPEEIAGLLDDRFSLLRSPVRVGPERHRSLQAVVDWSYQLLSDDERTLFRRLAVFRGGFGLDAVRVVCSGPPVRDAEIVGLLEELVDRSLVLAEHQPGGASRYRLLETLREYSRDVSSPNELSRTRDAHASYFCELAEAAAPRLRGPEQKEWLDRLRVDYGNLRLALRWSFGEDKQTGIRVAIALADMWDAVGPRGEAQHWLGRAVEATNSCCEHLYIPARLAAADIFMSTDLSHSARYAEEALQRAREVGDARAEAGALRELGWARGLEEKYDEAVALGAASLEMWREIGDPWEVAWSLERFAQSDHPHPEEALDRLEESLSIYRGIGDLRRAGMVLYKMGEAAVRAGVPLQQAESWVEESLAIFEAMGSSHDAAHARLELGKIKRRSDPAAAVAFLSDALEGLRNLGDERCSLAAVSMLGITLVDRDESAASEALMRGLEMGVALNDRQSVRVALGGMAQLLMGWGRAADAARIGGAADGMTRELDARTGGGRRQRFRGSLIAALGPEEFERAWQDGREMSVVDAVDLARRMMEGALDDPTDVVGSGGRARGGT